MNKLDITIYAGILLVIIGASIISFRAITIGYDPKDFSTICLNGVEYHTINFAMKNSLAIKLTPNGDPVTCVEH